MNCSAVREAWGLGHTSVYPLEEKSARYIAGYVLKKLHTKLVAEPTGSFAESFQRMSRMPYGLGARAPSIQSAVRQYLTHPNRLPDVLPYLKWGKYPRPLGRYLTNKIREQVEPEVTTPQERELRTERRLARLRESLFDVYAAAGVLAVQEGVSVRSVVARAIHQENLQEAVNQAARSRRRETFEV